MLKQSERAERNPGQRVILSPSRRKRDMSFLIVNGGGVPHRLVSELIQAEFPEATLVSIVDRRSGLDLIERVSPDVVILDIGHPAGEGLSLCSEIRRRSQAVIVVVGENASVEDQVRALDLGADDYLAYPFDPRELSARIKARVRAMSKRDELRRPERRMTLGNISINLELREARVAGQPIQLSPIEFDILALLAANEGRVVFKESLARIVWQSVDPPVEQVKTYVYRLRKKCCTPARSGGAVIENVRGIGYRLRRASRC